MDAKRIFYGVVLFGVVLGLAYAAGIVSINGTDIKGNKIT